MPLKQQITFQQEIFTFCFENPNKHIIIPRRRRTNFLRMLMQGNGSLSFAFCNNELLQKYQFLTCTIFYFIVYVKTIITTINDLTLRVFTSVNHLQVTLRLNYVLVVYVLTCQWLVYGTLCVVFCFSSSVGVVLCLCFVFSFL